MVILFYPTLLTIKYIGLYYLTILLASEQQVGIVWFWRTQNCMLRQNLGTRRIFGFRFCCTTGDDILRFAPHSQAWGGRGRWPRRLWHQDHGSVLTTDLKSDSNCLSTSPIDNLHSQKWFRNHPIRMDMPNQFASKATVFFSNCEWDGQNLKMVARIELSWLSYWALLTHWQSTWFKL